MGLHEETNAQQRKLMLVCTRVCYINGKYFKAIAKKCKVLSLGYSKPMMSLSTHECIKHQNNERLTNVFFPAFIYEASHCCLECLIVSQQCFVECRMEKENIFRYEYNF